MEISHYCPLFSFIYFVAVVDDDDVDDDVDDAEDENDAKVDYRRETR